MMVTGKRVNLKERLYI